MLLNRLEKALMNNPVRASLQRRLEARWLLQMGGRMRGGVALEVGCGRGVGTGIVLDRFGASRVDAFDLDPHMVELARERLSSRGDRVRLWTGDATRIEAADATYDAVFDFVIIHHVPRWRDALKEVFRVLKPGGRFYAEEVLAKFIHHPVWRRLLEHPMEDRFDRQGFRDGLEAAGLRVVDSRELFGQFAWFVADRPLH
jgi:ubiquinone/menaquinone biosynthesis C-methylase UbiE